MAQREKKDYSLSDHQMRSYKVGTVNMSGRSGRGEHKVNIECRKAEKDDATYRLMTDGELMGGARVEVELQVQR
jgi:hypothetical protein